MIGRTSELARISELCAENRESALLVLGGAGVGKSRLIEAARQACPHDAAILRVNPSETVWPFAGLSLLLSLVDDIHVADLTTITRDSPTTPDALFETARRVLDTVRRLSLAPQLVLIDDIDRMDTPSRRVISFIAGRLRATGLRLVVTATQMDPSLTFGPALTLGALSRHEALMVAKGMAGPAFEESTLSILVDQTDGNPLAIRENIARLTDAEARGATAIRLPLAPSSVSRRSSAHRLAGLGKGKRALLERLSSTPLLPRDLATRGESLAEDLLQDLITSGLVTEHGTNVRMDSAILRSHLYWSLTSRERRALHESEAAAAKADSRFELWHRSFSSSDGSTARGLIAAAVALTGEDEMVAAIEFAERARSLGHSVSGELDGIPAFSAALFRHADLAGAARYAELGSREDTAVSSRLILAHLRLQIEFLHSLKISDLEVDSWADLYGARNPRPTAELLVIASLYRAERWEIGQARHLIERALHLVEGGSLEGVDKVQELLLALENPSATHTPLSPGQVAASSSLDLLVSARAALLREQYDEARHLCTVVLKHRPADIIWVDTAQYLLAEVELCAEQPYAARAEIARWKALPSSESRPSYGAKLEAWLAHAENRTSDAVDLISAELDSPRHEHGPATRSFLYCLRGQIALTEDDLDTAIRMLGHADLIDSTLDTPGLVRHLPDLVEAHYRADRLSELRQTLDRFEERRSRHPSQWADRAAARIAAIVADDDHAIALFNQAIEAARHAEAGVELGRLHALKAARLARLERPSESQRSYLAARDCFEECGDLAWARLMDDRLAAIAFESFPSEENAALSALTDEEKRIVKYVQLGLRNKEIALALYIAVRTVELRLTHIYRTVGVRSRSELISTLRE